MITQTTLSDRVISQKIGTSAELNDALKTIDNLKEDIVELNTTIDNLEDTIEIKDDIISNIDTQHQEEINAINQNHANEIAEINSAHSTEINELNKEHQAEIESINQGYIDRDNELMVIINDINTLL